MKESPLKSRKMSEPCHVCKGQGNDSPSTICFACYGSGKEYIVCDMCWNKKSPKYFHAKRGNGFVKTCRECREKYRYGPKKDPRQGLPDKGPIRVKLNVTSNNTKTGLIPVSMTSSPTCPTSCSQRNGICYAESYFLGMHWRRLSNPNGKGGMSWDKFCEKVSFFPKRQVWRHNEAGDLPGFGDLIDNRLLKQLILANYGKRGFTYTHKPVLEDDGTCVANRVAIFESNKQGFTINLSADCLEHADRLFDLGVAPVVVTLPQDAPEKMLTPKGRSVIVCPSQLSELTCSECVLCARLKKRSIIGFRAHGLGRKRVGSSRQLSMFRS